MFFFGKKIKLKSKFNTLIFKKTNWNSTLLVFLYHSIKILCLKENNIA